MSGPQFTRGPWRWQFVARDGERSDSYTLFGNEGRARVLIIGENHRAIPVGADERLLASAPDLYAALERLTRHVDPGGLGGGYITASGDDLRAARSALARARGEVQA